LSGHRGQPTTRPRASDWHLSHSHSSRDAVMIPRPPDPDFEKPLEDFQGQLEHDAQNYMRAIKPVLDRGRRLPRSPCRPSQGAVGRDVGESSMTTYSDWDQRTARSALRSRRRPSQGPRSARPCLSNRPGVLRHLRPSRLRPRRLSLVRGLSRPRRGVLLEQPRPLRRPGRAGVRAVSDS
jgi:hypothetical protein